MKKIVLFLLPLILAVLVFLGFVFLLQRNNPDKGALQVTAQPVSTVYLNGIVVGKTPLCKCDPRDMLPVGDYTIRLVPLNSGYDAYEEKITVTQSVLTVVDRTFGDVGKSSGSIISLLPIKDSKDAQIFVSSFPYGSDVMIDSNLSGVTPLTIDHVTDSDHELKVSKAGYTDKIVHIHGVLGYTLHAVVSLATDLKPSGIPSATPSGLPLVTGTPVPSLTPAKILQGPQITILDTPTGFLRVRDSASLGGAEIGQVHPGEIYSFLGEQDGWYNVQLHDGKTGWISAAYAKKNN